MRREWERAKTASRQRDRSASCADSFSAASLRAWSNAAAAAAPGSDDGRSDMAPVGGRDRLCEGVPNFGEWLLRFCGTGFFFLWTGTASKSAQALTSSGFASSVKKASAPGASQFGAT